jgi:hypothetical protein
MKILVVEDERKIADLVRKALEASGFIVETCNNGDEALVWTSRSTFDAVVLPRNDAPPEHLPDRPAPGAGVGGSRSLVVVVASSVAALAQRGVSRALPRVGSTNASPPRRMIGSSCGSSRSSTPCSTG